MAALLAAQHGHQQLLQVLQMTSGVWYSNLRICSDSTLTGAIVSTSSTTLAVHMSIQNYSKHWHWRFQLPQSCAKKDWLCTPDTSTSKYIKFWCVPGTDPNCTGFGISLGPWGWLHTFANAFPTPMTWHEPVQDVLQVPNGPEQCNKYLAKWGHLGPAWCGEFGATVPHWANFPQVGKIGSKGQWQCSPNAPPSLKKDVCFIIVVSSHVMVLSHGK